MSLASFQALCREICGAPVSPAAVPDAADSGMVAVNFELAGSRIDLMYASRRAGQTAFAIVDFGPAPARQTEQAWRMLMEANLFMLEDWPAAFARHPGNGHALLKLPLNLAEAQAAQLLERLVRIAQVARDWRTGTLEGCELGPLLVAHEMHNFA